MTVIGSVPYWREIRLDDRSTGWAAKRFLEPVTAPDGPFPALALPLHCYQWEHQIIEESGGRIHVTTVDKVVGGVFLVLFLVLLLIG